MLKFRTPYDKAAKNSFLDSRHYDQLISGDEPVVFNKPDGSPLLIFRPGAVPPEVCNGGRDEFRRAGSIYSGNRKINSGHIGSLSDAKHGCRQMELSAADVKRWPKVLPLIQAVNAVFHQQLPERHAAQQAAAHRSHPKWVIEGTCFTTTTVNLWDSKNHNARTPVHRDKGDLPAGFGVISVLRSGDYRGGELIFPEFGVAVDLREGAVLLADVHELHGNAPIEPGTGPWERIATISYFRTSLLRCPQQKG